MTNNKLCDLFAGAGCVISCLGMGLLFFGVMSAAWVCAAGLMIAAIGVTNYD